MKKWEAGDVIATGLIVGLPALLAIGWFILEVLKIVYGSKV